MKFETTLINIATEGPGVSVLPHLNTLAVSGPFNVTGVGDTPSRRKIFTCGPAREAEKQTPAPANHFDTGASGLSPSRRPLTMSATLCACSRPVGRRAAISKLGFDWSSKRCSRIPEFVFRCGAHARRDEARIESTVITDLELASRLSFFLWSSGPDETPARSGRRKGSSREPAVLERAGSTNAGGRASGGAREELRVAVAALAQPARLGRRIRATIRTPTRTS